ncbi:MAG: hypothetical protein ABF285_12255 [Pacificibacter sp.]|uniref:hypothetical protein n=1 Tax=Pacificibacter sp. TaxID=1917866 RepID=UPI0032198D1D
MSLDVDQAFAKDVSGVWVFVFPLGYSPPPPKCKYDVFFLGIEKAWGVQLKVPTIRVNVAINANYRKYRTIMPKNNNVYYEILRWGNERIDEGVSFDDMQNFLESLPCTSLTVSRAEAVFCELFTPLEKGGMTTHAIIDACQRGAKFHLKVESTFRFLERQELEEARQSSRSAMTIAILSIVIGAIVGMVQIYLATQN